MMDIVCDSCGKKYRIDETKMTKQSAKVKCKACNNIMVIRKPEQQSAPEASVSFEEQELTAPHVPPAATETEEPARAAEKDTRFTPKQAYPVYGKQKIRFGLFAKIIIIMLIVSLVPFAIFWFITFEQSSERIRTDTESIMAQTAVGLGNQVTSWINNNIAVLRTASRLPDIVSMNRYQQEEILKAIHEEYPWMYLVFTVGPDGMNVARNDGQPLKDYSDRQYYKDIMEGKNLAWQTLIGKTSKVPALVLAVPIKSNDQIVGVMAAAMTVEDISNNIATWEKGKTGYAFLLDEKGFVISHPNKSYINPRKNLNNHPLIVNYRKRGWTTITTPFIKSDGTPALGHVRSNQFGWALALQQDESEVFAPLKSVQNFAYTLMGCWIVFVGLIAWFFSRALVNPITKLTDAAERMSLGELNVKIDVRSKDEIGQLAQALSRMQTSLRMAMNRLRRKR